MRIGVQRCVDAAFEPVFEDEVQPVQARQLMARDLAPEEVGIRML